jgi:hypothetical protein
MDILENFRDIFLLFLPLVVPIYLVTTLTCDYLQIYKPERLPGFMRSSDMTRQQIEARDGNIIPLIKIRLLNAIFIVVAASLVRSVDLGFLETIKIQ